MDFKFRKSTISVTGEGCFRCGTLWSSGWHPLKEVPIKIGNKTAEITLSVCNDCASNDEKNTNQATLSGSNP